MESGGSDASVERISAPTRRISESSLGIVGVMEMKTTVVGWCLERESKGEGNRSTFEAACRGNPFSFAPFEMESDEACKRGGADRGNGAEEMS
ncbi:hypothetical protein LXL04_003758 [Taraxacum kok-saghyz]